MNLITTNNEIELNAMKIAEQNHWQVEQIKRQWQRDSVNLRLAILNNEDERFTIYLVIFYISLRYNTSI